MKILSILFIISLSTFFKSAMAEDNYNLEGFRSGDIVFYKATHNKSKIINNYMDVVITILDLKTNKKYEINKKNILDLAKTSGCSARYKDVCVNKSFTTAKQIELDVLGIYPDGYIEVRPKSKNFGRTSYAIGEVNLYRSFGCVSDKEQYCMEEMIFASDTSPSIIKGVSVRGEVLVYSVEDQKVRRTDPVGFAIKKGCKRHACFGSKATVIKSGKKIRIVAVFILSDFYAIVNKDLVIAVDSSIKEPTREDYFPIDITEIKVKSSQKD